MNETEAEVETAASESESLATPSRSLANVAVLGACIVFAAAIHAWLSAQPVTTAPLKVGTAVGDILVRQSGGVAHHKCGGCRVECYESFVVVYVDKEKQPTWTGNYVLTFPWSKIEHLTLQGESPSL